VSDLGQEATYLMGNEAFVHVTKSARDALIAKAMACSAQNDEGRRRYLDAAKTVDRVVSHLNALVAASKTGKEVDVSTFYEDQARERFKLFRR
jgi:hypothetical protein